LNGQKAAVKAGLPSNFIDQAELSAFGWKKKAVVVEEPKPKKVKKEKPVKVKKEKKIPVTKEVVKEKEKAAAGGFGFFKWLIPLLLILGLIWLLMTRGCGAAEQVSQTVKNNVPTTAAVKDVVKEKAAAATTAVTSGFGKVNDAAMGLLKNIKFAAGSAGQQMMDFINKGEGAGEGRFRFTNLNFASGSSTIAGSSGLEVDNLSSILKAYQDIKVKIEGYTDSQGNAASNQTLSQKRAEAVRARLIAAGIPDARISTEGFGAANPVATNDTPEGRAENRRIEVIIVK